MSSYLFTFLSATPFKAGSPPSWQDASGLPVSHLISAIEKIPLTKLKFSSSIVYLWLCLADYMWMFYIHESIAFFIAIPFINKNCVLQQAEIILAGVCEVAYCLIVNINNQIQASFLFIFELAQLYTNV